MNELNNPENVTKNNSVARWLFLITALAVVMVVLGGVVRLTESGLSMVDWHIVTKSHRLKNFKLLFAKLG